MTDAAPETQESKVSTEMRCKFCNKFITKIIVEIEVFGEDGKKKVGKVGFETRCPRCKQFVYHLFIV